MSCLSLGCSVIRFCHVEKVLRRDLVRKDLFEQVIISTVYNNRKNSIISTVYNNRKISKVWSTKALSYNAT